MRNPIWFTRAEHNVCRLGHKVRKSGTSTRGSCVLLHDCQHDTCTQRYALGIQNTELDLTIWFAVTRAVWERISKTEPVTPVLTLLAVAGYHDADPT